MISSLPLSSSTLLFSSALPSTLPLLSSLSPLPPPSRSLLSRPALSSPLLLSPSLQTRSFFEKKKSEANLFNYFAPRRPLFFPPQQQPQQQQQQGEERLHRLHEEHLQHQYDQNQLDDVKASGKPSFMELAKQLKPFSWALLDVCVWKALMWKKPTPDYTRRETMLSRVISQELRISVPYLVVFLLPFIGSFALPAMLLFVANTSPTSLPRLFWTERIHLRARQDLWRRKRETKQKLRRFLVKFVEKNHASLCTLDIFDVDKIKQALAYIEGRDETKWEEGVSALIPFLESDQFMKSEFISEEKKTIFHSFNPTTKTHSYSESTFESLGRYLMTIDEVIEQNGIKNLPNQDVVWLCEERGLWGDRGLEGDDWIENLPFPDDEQRIERMRQKLENWLEISKCVRKKENLLTYYNLLVLFGGPYYE